MKFTRVGWGDLTEAEQDTLLSKQVPHQGHPLGWWIAQAWDDGRVVVGERYIDKGIDDAHYSAEEYTCLFEAGSEAAKLLQKVAKGLRSRSGDYVHTI